MSEESPAGTAKAASVPWYQRFLNWLKRASRKLFEIVLPGVRAAVAQFLNDERNQQLALAAVKAAIDAGLRGGDAWNLARQELAEQLEASGKKAAATLIDTLLQNAYCAVKYSVQADGDERAY